MIPVAVRKRANCEAPTTKSRNDDCVYPTPAAAFTNPSMYGPSGPHRTASHTRRDRMMLSNVIFASFAAEERWRQVTERLRYVER